jgi:hypothetical protein
MAIEKVIEDRGQFFFQNGHGKIYFENLLIYDNNYTGMRFFNLPKGNYNFVGNFAPGKETEFLKCPLALPVKDWDKFKNPSIILDEKNMSPASIYLDSATIVVNREFLTLPFYAQAFILYHEIGHLYYDNEVDADAYAFYKCWENGIPVTMGIRTHLKTLTTGDENKERILKALEIAEFLTQQINKKLWQGEY